MSRVMNYFYIIKVECGKAHKTWYKIGEECSEKRIKTLVNKYTQYRNNDAEHLATWNIPHDAEHRLTDKAIHKYLTTQYKNEVKQVDKIHAEHYLGTSDGTTEFFEIIQPSFDLVDCVNTFITTCDASLYTGKFEKEETKLSYGRDKYHLVNNILIEKILTKFPIVNRMLYKEFNNNVLLIGQFEHDFVASIALHHNVTTLHDTADNIHQFSLTRLNNVIKYIETVEDLYTMKFDLIIANPPYGSVGANITKNIIDNVYFEEYVNLLPANDYKRNDSKDLFRYAREMESINNGFKDAKVTTHLCKIAKEANNMTVDEFEISNYIDRSLDKYFYENFKADSIWAYATSCTKVDYVKNWDLSKVVIMTCRDVAHGHMPYTKDCLSYKLNYNAVLPETVLKKAAHNLCVMEMATAQEKNNLVKFLYSKNGFRFISKTFVAMNKDGGFELTNVFPKVDWTRSWTVEEILREYNYSDSEILEIMNDLDNFKYMKD